MKNLTARWAFLLILATVIPGCAKTGMNAGEAMPNLEFYDFAGNRTALVEFFRPGKLLLVHFWGAACCLTYSKPTFRAVSEVHESGAFSDVTVLSVNLDYPPKRVRKIMTELDIRHPVLNDRDGVFYEQVPALKNVFPLALILVVDGDGRIRGKMMGPQLFPAISDLVRQAGGTRAKS